MNFSQIWPLILQIATGIFVPLATALGVWGVGQIKRWQAKSDLKTMKQNSIDAVQAIEQLYSKESGEYKKQLALDWARHLNKVAGINGTEKTQLILNESSVLSLPPTQSVSPSAPESNSTMIPKPGFLGEG